jgi:hypothetical protein
MNGNFIRIDGSADMNVFADLEIDRFFSKESIIDIRREMHKELRM